MRRSLVGERRCNESDATFDSIHELGKSQEM